MMATFISPIKHANLWNSGSTLSHVPYDDCGCLKKREVQSSCDILGHKSHISIHLFDNLSRNTLVKSSWIRCHTTHYCRPPVSVFRSRSAKSWFLLCPFVLATARDEEKIVKCIRTTSLGSKHSFSNFVSEDKNNYIDADDLLSDDEEFSVGQYPVEEPWLSATSILFHHITEPEAWDELVDGNEFVESNNIDFQESVFNESPRESGSFSESGNAIHAVNMGFKELQPVEEPWLCESLLVPSDTEVKVIKSEFQGRKPVKDQSVAVDLQEQLPEKLLTKEQNNIISQDSVSTIILINSSICTLQRIAVLEDNKLVELLLEPVKNNVQCDSVYLGVVTKLVPHMGGAFVNIGSPRPSFMDMKSKREPFIFPPFCHHANEKEVNCSGEDVVLPAVYEDEYHLDDVEEGDDIEENESESIEDFRKPNLDDHFGISEIIGENVNGNVERYDIGADSGRSLDHVNDNEQFEGLKVGKLFSIDMGWANDTQLPHPVKLENFEGAHADDGKWFKVQKGTKIIVQVVKEGLGTKGPTVTAYPKLRSRFWVLSTRGNKIGISKKISGVERTLLRVIAKTLQPQGFGLTVRTVAAGHSLEDLQKDLLGLVSTWKAIVGHAKSATLAADEGVEGAVPLLLHRAMGQTLSVVQDYFNEKVKSMIVDSLRTYNEVMNYLQEIAPDLCDRVNLYNKSTPLFDEYNIEEELNTILSKRVPLSNGGYLVIEQTEALVSIDVNGGHCMLGQGTSQEKAILDVNISAARQIARELRLRDIGGIIVVDFIDMKDDSNKRLVYEEVKNAVEKDRSTVKVGELSRHGLMEITRKRVRPSVTFMISEPCPCCHATGRVEALETSFSKIEHEICRHLAIMNQKGDPENPNSWPRFILRVDQYMCNYLTSGKKTRLALLSSSLKVWILLKVARHFNRGAFELKPLTDDEEVNDKHGPAISMLKTEVGSYNPSRKVTLFPIKKWRTGGK